MKNFNYRAKKGPFETVEGVVEANDLSCAVKVICHKGFSPIEIFESGEKDDSKKKYHLPPFIHFAEKINKNDVIHFTRQLCDLVEAAVPILQSIDVIRNNTKKAVLKAVVEDVYLKIKNGFSLSKALAIYPDVFSPFYINLIRSGEISGALDKVLMRLADNLERQGAIRSNIISDMTYPAFIFFTGIVTIIVLVSFVIPRIKDVFFDIQQELPLPTILIMDMGDMIIKYWIYIILALVVLIFFMKKRIRSEKGRYFLDNKILKVPILNSLIKKIEAARFVGVLGVMVANGVPLVTALKSSCPLIKNKILRKEMVLSTEHVEKGKKLSTAISKSSLLSDIALSMIMVCEETGNLKKGLYKISCILERQLDEELKIAVSILNPLVLIIVVSFVGFIVIAMVLPIVRINMLAQ